MKRLLLALAIAFGTFSAGLIVQPVDAYYGDSYSQYDYQEGVNAGFVDGQNGSDMNIPERYLGNRDYVAGYQSGYRAGYQNYLENLKQELEYQRQQAQYGY